jgi:hypothetical protein
MKKNKVSSGKKGKNLLKSKDKKKPCVKVNSLSPDVVNSIIDEMKPKVPVDEGAKEEINVAQLFLEEERKANAAIEKTFGPLEPPKQKEPSVLSFFSKYLWWH